MRIPTPSEDRLDLIQLVYDGGADPNLLTEDEYVYLQDCAMSFILDEMAKKNPMVFGEVEDGLVN